MGKFIVCWWVVDSCSQKQVSCYSRERLCKSRRLYCTPCICRVCYKLLYFLILHVVIVLFGPLRNAFLLAKCLFNIVVREQGFGPPSFGMWSSAKGTYRQLLCVASSTNPLDYTWNQLATACRRILEVYLFYKVGFSMGSGIKKAIQDWCSLTVYD